MDRSIKMDEKIDIYSPELGIRRKIMTYEYQVLTAGGSSFDNLERIGNRLQEVLNGDDAA